jgi:hypothetical protein
MTSLQRPHEDQNVWNFIFSLFFVLVLVGVLWEFWNVYRNFPNYVDPFDALLMSLAAFRITRLLVYDKITRWFRELFAQKRSFEKDGHAWVEIVPYQRGFRATVYDLLGCPWCIGFWSAIVIAFCYFMFSWAWFVIFFLALAGAGSLVQLVANLIGWHAENLKLDAHEKELRSNRALDRSSLGK